MPELSLTLGNVGSTFLFHLSLGLDPEQLVGIEQGIYGTSAYGRCCRRSHFPNAFKLVTASQTHIETATVLFPHDAKHMRSHGYAHWLA